MELINTFDVSASPDAVWRTVGDMRQVALCLPGAVIEAEDGDTYRGRVSIKVGPISMGLGGTATVVQRDHAARRMEVRIEAEDVTGQGTVEATMVVSAVPVATGTTGTTVEIATSMRLGGKVAQFGSGLITQVSGRVVKQVAKRLDALIESGGDPAGPDTAGPVPTPRTRAPRGAARYHAGAVVPLVAVAIAGAVLGWSLGQTLQAVAAR